MWGFLEHFLSAAGVSATLFVAATAALGFALRAVWLQHERALTKLSDTNQELLKALDASRREMDELQEKRLADSVKFTERVIEHVNRLDRSMERLAASIDAIYKVVGRG